MDAQGFIREIGRGRDGARGLSREAATRMFEALLDGALGELELGAILVALRMKGESLDELDAGLGALAGRMRRVGVDGARPAVAIPSYNGARHTANLVPLLACLLADAGLQVVVHGVTEDPRRTTTAAIMAAMGLAPAADVDAARASISRGDPAFVPVAVLSPALARLLALRWRLGVRNVGHSLAKLMNPTDSPCCLRLASHTHPEFAALQHAYFERSREPALVLRATEGEVVASTRREAQIDWMHEGRCRTLVPAGTGPARDLPALPDAHDAPATARWIQSVLAGERPVPEPIERQVAAVIEAARTAVPHPAAEAA
jgi:anthranilate phosphoribosyltransferase